MTDPALFGREVAEGSFALLLNVQGSSFAPDFVATQFPGSFMKFGQTGHEVSALPLVAFALLISFFAIASCAC